MARTALTDHQVQLLKGLEGEEQIMAKDLTAKINKGKRPNKKRSENGVRHGLDRLVNRSLVKSKTIKGHNRRAAGYALTAAGRKALAKVT